MFFISKLKSFLKYPSQTLLLKSIDFDYTVSTKSRSNQTLSCKKSAKKHRKAVQLNAFTYTLRSSHVHIKQTIENKKNSLVFKFVSKNSKTFSL